MDGNGQQGNGQMDLTRLQQYKADLQTQSRQLYGEIRQLQNQNVDIWDQAVAYYNMRQQYFASLCNLPQQLLHIAQCNWVSQEQQMAASCTQVLEIANYIGNYNLCQSQIQQWIAAVDIQILYIEQQASDKPNTTQAEVQIHPDVVEVADLNQITAATGQACQKNPETTKSATERIRDLPVYTALQDLQAAVKEIFKDCTITVGGEQQSVSSYFDRFNPNHDSVVFWSECGVNRVIDQVVANTIAKKIDADTFTKISNRNGGINFCNPQYNFGSNNPQIFEFNISSSFLAAQNIENVCFVTGMGENANSKCVWRDYELPLLLRNPSVKQIIRVDAQIYNSINATDFQEKLEFMTKIIFDRTAYEAAHKTQNPGQSTEVINKIHDRIINVNPFLTGIDASYVDIQPNPVVKDQDNSM